MDMDMNIERAHSFSIVDHDGVCQEYEILFTFNWEETGLQYIVFTDNTTDSSGNIVTYAATYEVNSEGVLSLSNVDSEEEWALIETLLDKIESAFEDYGEDCPESLHFEL